GPAKGSRSGNSPPALLFSDPKEKNGRVFVPVLSYCIHLRQIFIPGEHPSLLRNLPIPAPAVLSIPFVGSRLGRGLGGGKIGAVTYFHNTHQVRRQASHGLYGPGPPVMDTAVTLRDTHTDARNPS